MESNRTIEILKEDRALSPCVKPANSFWENFYVSHCKTAMLLISLIVTLAFAVSELAGRSSDRLETAFFIVIGYWAGRSFTNHKR